MFEVVGDGKVKRTQVALFTQVRASCLEQFRNQNQMETHMALKWPPELTSPNRKYNPIQNATSC